MKSGNLNFLEPSGGLGLVTETALLLLYVKYPLFLSDFKPYRHPVPLL